MNATLPKMLKAAEDAHVLKSGNLGRLQSSPGRAVLDRLDAAGVRVTADGGHLVVRPRSLLTDELRALIREHKAMLITLLGLHVDLRDVAPVALRFGSLVTCEQCQHFDGRPNERPDGWCRCHAVETWRRVPFNCAAFQSRLNGTTADEWSGSASGDPKVKGSNAVRESVALGAGGGG